MQPASTPVIQAAAPSVKQVLTYGVTKGANDYQARAAGAYADEGIRSYGILPGAFETKMLQEIAAQQGMDATTNMAGFNPVYGFGTHFKPSVGDPKDIGNVLLAMFDNSTTYKVGTTVVADNDVTMAAEVFYTQLHTPNPEGSGPWAFPLGEDTIRDFRGNPYVAKKDEL